MTKLHLDESGIENSVIPALNNCILNMSNLQRQLDSLVIPDDFEYANSLKNFGSENRLALEQLKTKKTKIEESIKNIKQIEKNNLEDYLDIEILNLPIRSNNQ